jgi:hypothetical protein
MKNILVTLSNLKHMFVSERWLESPYCRKFEKGNLTPTLF